MPVQSIVLARHAQALERSIAALTGVAEAQRPLTKKGIKVQREMTQVARRWLKKTDILFRSPFLRAIETADIISEYSSISDLSTSRYLLPNASPTPFIDRLRKLNLKLVVIVGHEPNFSHLLSELLELDLKESIILKKSSFCKLSWDSNSDKYILSGLLNPK